MPRLHLSTIALVLASGLGLSAAAEEIAPATAAEESAPPLSGQIVPTEAPEATGEEIQPADHYIDLLGSFVHPDKGRHTRAVGYGGTLIYGVHWTGPLWVEGRGSAILFETGRHAGTDFYQYGGGLDLVGAIGDRQGFTPFLLLGAGGVYDDVQPDRDDSFNFRGDAGAGFITAPITSRGLKLRAEARALYDTFESGQLDWQFSLGLSIPLGGGRVVERVVVREVPVTVVERAAPPPDGDADGVPDRFDHCPDTLPEGDVDTTGCLIQGQTIIVENVHFEFDSDRLTPDAEKVLDRVAESLRQQSAIHFEIAGHTDSMGSDAYNDGLSQARANAVLRFLAERGVDAQRMSAYGYGERQPIETNDTDAGRARNRRVEFRFQPRGLQ